MQDPSIRTMRGIALVIVVLAVFGFVMGAKAIRKTLHPTAGGPGNFKTLDEQESERTAGLKNQDTDHDGISDYDELLVYRTSPYLEDTDSDTFGDKTEIDSGNDPNCPRGKVCGGAEMTVSVSSTLLTPAPGNTGLVAPDIFSLLGKTPKEIREALKAAGVAPELLDKVDDKTLMDLYRQALSESATSSTPK